MALTISIVRSDYDQYGYYDQHGYTAGLPGMRVKPFDYKSKVMSFMGVLKPPNFLRRGSQKFFKRWGYTNQRTADLRRQALNEVKDEKIQMSLITKKLIWNQVGLEVSNSK